MTDHFLSELNAGMKANAEKDSRRHVVGMHTYMAKTIWTAVDGDQYKNHIFETNTGDIGMNVDGFVIVRPLREWFALADQARKFWHQEK